VRAPGDRDQHPAREGRHHGTRQGADSRHSDHATPRGARRRPRARELPPRVHYASSMGAPTPSLRSLWRLRLGLGGVVLLGAIIAFLATSWDIQWHTLIGRDRTLIPPHQMILTGVALAGLAALA